MWWITLSRWYNWNFLGIFSMNRNSTNVTLSICSAYNCLKLITEHFVFITTTTTDIMIAFLFQISQIEILSFSHHSLLFFYASIYFVITVSLATDAKIPARKIGNHTHILQDYVKDRLPLRALWDAGITIIPNRVLMLFSNVTVWFLRLVQKWPYGTKGVGCICKSFVRHNRKFSDRGTAKIDAHRKTP